MENNREQKLEITAKRLGIHLQQIPRNIAIIMDGNGRWAKSKGLPRVEGHRKGGKTVERIALDGVDLGIESLTLYAFSTENWKRPKAEIKALMILYTQYLVGIRQMMMKNNVRLVHLGRRDSLPEKLKKELLKSMEMTSGNTGMVLALALNYSGRSEIVDAIKEIAEEYKNGKIDLEDINEDHVSKHLYVSELAEPDILIRTANERRVSNFLLWQISYSEFYTTETLWPDFKKKDLEEAITVYSQRKRSFGNIDIAAEDI